MANLSCIKNLIFSKAPSPNDTGSTCHFNKYRKKIEFQSVTATKSQHEPWIKTPQNRFSKTSFPSPFTGFLEILPSPAFWSASSKGPSSSCAWGFKQQEHQGCCKLLLLAGCEPRAAGAENPKHLLPSPQNTQRGSQCSKSRRREQQEILLILEHSPACPGINIPFSWALSCLPKGAGC